MGMLAGRGGGVWRERAVALRTNWRRAEDERQTQRAGAAGGRYGCSFLSMSYVLKG